MRVDKRYYEKVLLVIVDFVGRIKLRDEKFTNLNDFILVYMLDLTISNSIESVEYVPEH